MKELPKNTFFDISKFPKDYGILVFPISIARMEHGNGQSAPLCIEYLKHFAPNKISEPKVGLNMIYGDYLYMHSQEPAAGLKSKFMTLIMKHKNGFMKLLQKEKTRFQIHQAFSFEVWNQLYLSYKGGDFGDDFNDFKKWYKTDKVFQKYLKDDAEYCKRELTSEQIDFFLEEHFILYQFAKKRFSFPNEYVNDREKWVLWCYPGKPLKGTIYVYQKNPLNLSVPENPYENCTYDLEAKKLIDFNRIDLETYNYKYEN